MRAFTRDRFDARHAAASSVLLTKWLVGPSSIVDVDPELLDTESHHAAWQLPGFASMGNEPSGWVPGFAVGGRWRAELGAGQGVKIERCRVLDQSGCVAVCANVCKYPTQKFFTEGAGLPLTMVSVMWACIVLSSGLPTVSPKPAVLRPGPGFRDQELHIHVWCNAAAASRRPRFSTGLPRLLLPHSGCRRRREGTCGRGRRATGSASWWRWSERPSSRCFPNPLRATPGSPGPVQGPGRAAASRW